MNDNTGNGPTVVSLPEKPNELAATLEEVKRNIDILIESAMVTARMRRASYLAYIESGFTPEQALVLCTK